MPALLSILIALALAAPAEAAPRRKPRLVCRCGTLTSIDGVPSCLTAPVWVR